MINLNEFNLGVKIGIIALSLAVISYIKSVALQELNDKYPYTKNGKKILAKIQIISLSLTQIALASIPFLILKELVFGTMFFNIDTADLVFTILFYFSFLLFLLHIFVDFMRIFRMNDNKKEITIKFDDSAKSLLESMNLSDDFKKILLNINELKIIKDSANKFSINKTVEQEVTD